MATILREKHRWYRKAELLTDLSTAVRQRRILGLIRAIRGAGVAGTLRGAPTMYQANCDIFWSFLVPEHIKEFRIAPPEVAVKFSWEVLPSRCYVLCKGNLPFGLHAWARYDFPFLKPLLERNGIELS